MKAVFKISYYLRSNYKNKNGKSPVMIRISLNGEMCNVGSAGLYVEPDKWDNKSSRIRFKTKEALSLNYKLDAITTELNQVFDRLKYNDDLSVEQIKNVFLGKDKVKMTFLQVLAEYNNNAKKTIGVSIVKATYLRFDRVYRYFRDFLKQEYQVNDISLKEINFPILDKFINYLKIDKKYSQNSASKFIQHIKTASNYAVKKGLLITDPIKDYVNSWEKVDRGYLLDDEIKTIINKEFPTERLSNVRDIFIFSCFTGLAYIDVANLTQDNLVENDGKFWIMTKRQKTNVASNILLLDIPLKIIEKHKRKAKDDKLLPVLSNQKMNSYLKEIADVCGINKRFTFHLARHTFATTITLSKGVPIETVSKMLGHTNIKTTQIYARITNEKIEKDMLSLANQLGNYAGA